MHRTTAMLIDSLSHHPSHSLDVIIYFKKKHKYIKSKIMAKIKVTKETKKGRNQKFEISRADLVKGIEQGIYPDYYIRVINGIKTPCSKPDKSKNNNLG